MEAKKDQTNRLKKKLWKNPEIINELFSNEEWEQYQQKAELSEAESEEIYERILHGVSRDHKNEGNRYKLRTRFYSIARYTAAASFLMVAGWVTYLKWSPETSVRVKTNKLVAVQKEAVQLPVKWQEVTNQNKNTKRVLLPDSSVITLYPHSTLKYENGLPKPLRDVFLIGKAYFKVKKNPKRPFSVYAGGLKTTALGTSFTINTLEGKLKTSVKLHTGRIVVSPEKQNSKQVPVYLTQAESGLIYDQRLELSSLMRKTAPAKISYETLLSQEGSKLMMKNIPLIKVIGLLSEAYQVEILANNKEIGNILYTGEVDTEKESIESVLQMICLINNMTLSKDKEGEYVLQKSIPAGKNPNASN